MTWLTDLRDPEEIVAENPAVDAFARSQFGVPPREARAADPDPADEDQMFEHYMKANFPQGRR